MTTPGFTHLHLHTQYSILDGAIPIKKLMGRAKDLGMPAVAMTDHGNMFGAVEFHQAAVSAGIKPIIGCEVYVASGSRFEKDASTGGFDGINHMVLLAMNQTGYRNLVQLVSRGYLEGFYYKPRIDMELLRACSEGLIATSGCLSGAVPNAIMNGRNEQAWRTVEQQSRLFGDRFYLELQRHGIPAQDKVNAELLKMSADLGIPLIATNDCHYLAKGDAHAHEALLCVQTGKTLDDPTRFRFDGSGFYVKDASEMLEAFSDIPQAVYNTLEVAERVNFVLETGKLQLPEFTVPEGHTSDTYLGALAERGLRERLVGDPERPLLAKHEAYQRRLRFELDIIKTCGYSGYFLIVWDFIRYAREHGIPVGPGRGSSAGSLAAYALRIVDIDPVELMIPFERFLNPERASMPDIDVDLCMNRRSEVIRYVENKYNGEGDAGRRVAGIVTFGTMQAKAAVRDVGRVRGMPFAEVDRVAKLIPTTLGITLDQALQDSKELRETVESDPALGELWDLARALEGQVRNPGRHAAGVVISSRPLLETTPLYRDPRTHEIVTQFDYRTGEKVGLIKFDFLGLRTLTVIHSAVARIRATHDPDFRIERTPLEDPETYVLLCRGDTEGIFQVGQSTGMTDLVIKMQPTGFRDLIPLVALYRPGPLQSGMVDDFIERRHGRTKVEYLLPEIEEIVRETYGVIVYQDQVMHIANRLASYSLGEGDLLRRAMGKKIPKEMAEQRERFLSGCRTNGHPADVSEKIFDLMSHFAGYAFAKSHSAAYALITHQTAYLKAHYPAEFYAATMTAEWRESEKLDRYMRDARRRDITIKPPDVNESDAEFTVALGGSVVRFGLAGVKNVGEGAVEAILEVRAAGGPFRSLFDFCERVDPHRVNRRVIESLIRCAAFDFIGVTRASLMAAVPKAIERGQRSQRDRAVGQRSLFGEVAPRSLEPKLDDVPEWLPKELLAGEKEMLGFYVTGHPLNDHARVLDLLSNVSLDTVGEEWRGKEARVGGLVTALATQKTRRGDLMARAMLEDRHGALPAVFFPKTFEQYSPLLRSGEPIFVRATVQCEGERSELHVDEVMLIDAAYGRFAKEVAVRVSADRLSEPAMKALRALLDQTPGPVAVSLVVELPTGACAELALPGHRISLCTELLAQIESLVGGEVSCRVA
jgi:DNA polymerase-3 subunit alpha